MGQASSSTQKNRIIYAAAKPPLASPSISPKLALGAGCYWGTEKFIVKDFQKKFPDSIQYAKVGFMSPDPQVKIKNPTYQQVCSGSSGHVEVLYVELKNPHKHFEELVRFFFSFHDPTTKNRQGNDSGFQYASFIFAADDEQNIIAQRVRRELQTLVDEKKVRKYSNKTVKTRIGPLQEFTEAHEGHQEYLSKNPRGYCNHYLRIKEWPAVDSIKEQVKASRQAAAASAAAAVDGTMEQVPAQ